MKGSLLPKFADLWIRGSKIVKGPVGQKALYLVSRRILSGWVRTYSLKVVFLTRQKRAVSKHFCNNRKEVWTREQGRK